MKETLIKKRLQFKNTGAEFNLNCALMQLNETFALASTKTSLTTLYTVLPVLLVYFCHFQLNKLHN